MYLKVSGLLDGSITMTTNSEDAAAIQKNLAALQSVIDSRQADIDLHKNNSNMIQLQIEALGEYTAPDSKGYENQKAQNKRDIEKWEDQLSGLDKESQEYKDISKKIHDATMSNIDLDYQIAVTTNSEDPNKAKREELAKQKKIEDQGVVLSEKAKADAEANKDKYVKEMKVAKLEAKTMGSEIKSPVAGKVVTVSKQAGEKTEPKETVAVIQVEGKGLCTKISVETRQANKVKVGDPVMIEDYFYYGCTANLAAIQPDKDDPKNKRTLLFDLVGEDFQAGGSVSLAVGQANQSFNLVIPKSGLREDTKGKYILILESKAVPFGTRYIAKKVDVTQVYAEDDMNVAIEAAVEPWGTYVITNQTKPIKNGDQVRLATEESK